MPLTVTINGTSQTAKVQEGTPSLKFNTFDVTLVDPAVIPANGQAVVLTNPTWSGTVTSRTRRPGPRIGHDFVTLTATNTDVQSASAGPWGLSDVPNGTTLRGYKDLSVTVSANLDATTTTTGTATLYDTGLWPAMTFALTNADLGYSATSFSVTGMEVTWVKGVPFYHLTFGDPIVTMSAWMQDTVTTMPDGSISGTKITDLSIVTSKFAANSVTAAQIAVGTLDPTLMSSGPANLVPNPGAEGATINAQTTLQGWTFTNCVVRLGVAQRSGNAVFQAIATAGAGYTPLRTAYLPVDGNRRYTGSVYLSGWGTNAATAQGALQISWYDQSKTIISNSVIGIVTKGTSSSFTLISGVVVSPSTAVWAQVLGVASGTVTVGDRLYWDDFAFYLSDFNINHAGGNVVIDPSGMTITNGAMTVTNGSSVVIIDGTSDMFKIAASGTAAMNMTGGMGDTVVDTALPGLGTLTTTPAIVGASVFDTTAQTGNRYPGQTRLNATPAFVANISGGSPTTAVAAALATINISAHLSGASSGTVSVQMWGANPAAGGNANAGIKFWVMQEAAL
jgi:hypothetical protein